MSDFYKGKRSRNLYNETSKRYKLSRSKIELFQKCPRCFYLDRRLGVGQPPGYPFNLNSAVDKLLKNEFDQHRLAGTPHPIMVEFGVSGVPFKHESMDKWRDSLRGGVEHFHEETGLVICGGIDDLWIDPDGWLNVVDYKATSKSGQVCLSAEWQSGYKRQMEIYQWLLRNNGFKVSDTGYFVYCNGNANASEFNSRLNFEVTVIPYVGNDSWVDEAVFNLKKCLDSSQVPEPSEQCDFCIYIAAINEVVNTKLEAI